MGGLISPDGAYCLACGKKRGALEGLPLCPDCARGLLLAARPKGFLCPRCLSALLPGKPCRFCARDEDRLIGQTYAPFRYRGTPRSLVLRLKFGGDTRAAAVLAPFLLKALTGRDYDALVPVPLSAARMRERGYNQAMELSQLVGWQAGIKTEELLRRDRSTKRQTDMHTFRDRKRNVQDAFSLKAGADVRGRRLLLVDDVRTTGSTALSCAETLVRAGAARVDLLAVCIAPGLARGRQKSLRGRFRPRREG